MKVAVTDACIFIELLEVEACDAFFRLPVEVITTKQVWGELESDHHMVLNRWLKSDELTIIANFADLTSIRRDYDLSRSLSVADLSVWTMCHQNGDVLLTSDGKLRKMAKEHKMETHGILWIFNQMVIGKLLSVPEAIEKLQGIFNQNIYYKSDRKLFDEYEVLISEWQNSTD